MIKLSENAIWTSFLRFLKFTSKWISLQQDESDVLSYNWAIKKRDNAVRRIVKSFWENSPLVSTHNFFTLLKKIHLVYKITLFQSYFDSDNLLFLPNISWKISVTVKILFRVKINGKTYPWIVMWCVNKIIWIK